MDAAIIYSLIFILAASRIEGTKVVVSIPEGEVDGRLSKIMEMIANLTKQERDDVQEERNHWMGLQREIEKEYKSIKVQLKELMNARAPVAKPKPAPTSEPTIASSLLPTVSPGKNGMVEIVITGGTPGASSEFDAEHFKAENAFKPDPHTHYQYSWTSTYRDFPAYIWYDFKRQLRPKKVSYLPRRSDVQNANAVRVKRFQFVGTNDRVCSKNSNWKVLCEGKSAPYKSLNDERGCIVPSNQSVQSFSCLGLKIIEGINNMEVSLMGIRIWLYQ